MGYKPIHILKRFIHVMDGKVDFCDPRSRKVALVPHCVLNQNARAAGAAVRPSGIAELVTALFERNIGIIQMPCPELFAFGLDRGHLCIEKELRTSSGRSMMRQLARDLVGQIRAYQDCRIHVLGILGKNGSPSCGVEETWAGHVCPGSGAFIDELSAELRDQKIPVEVAGFRDSEPGKAIELIDQWLAKFS